MAIFNPDWSFIINFFGIFLAILPLILGIKLSFSRELGLIHWNNYTSHEKIPDRNDIVKQIHRIQLIFQNHGKEVIYEKDIVTPIEIDLGVVGSISKVIFESNCKFNSLDFKIVGSKIFFTFNFLEYNKYIKAHLDYFSDEKVEATIKGKIIGGNELDYKIETDNRWDSYFVGKKNADANFFVFPFVTVGLFITIGFLFLRMFNINPDTLLETIQKFNKEAFLLLFVGLVLAAICIGLGMRIKRLFIPFVIYAEKEKNWYLKKEFKSA